VVADLGGKDQLSSVEAVLVETFSGLAVQIDDCNTRALLGEKIDLVARVTRTEGTVFSA
jgi:hypothetical protein